MARKVGKLLNKLEFLQPEAFSEFHSVSRIVMEYHEIGEHKVERLI